MISIIVPVFNTEKYLRDCIDSILKQTYGDLEVILVDDGSTDNSFDIITEYAKKDNRVKGYHKENSGVSATRNLGISKAQGELISFCDSDDVIEETLYETLFNCLTSQNVDRVCGGYEYLYPGGRRVYCHPRPKDGYYSKCNTLSMMIDDGTLSGFMFSGVNNSLFKKSIIDKYNIRFSEKIKFNEDSLFSLEYALHSGGVYSLRSLPLYLYRQHANSSTRKKILQDKYSQINEFLINMPERKYIDNFEIQMKRRMVTVALWNVLDISNCLSGVSAVRKIKEEISKDEVIKNIQYIDKNNLNRYKKIYFFMIKRRIAFPLYAVTKWVLPIASKYLSR